MCRYHWDAAVRHTECLLAAPDSTVQGVCLVMLCMLMSACESICFATSEGAVQCTTAFCAVATAVANGAVHGRTSQYKFVLTNTTAAILSTIQPPCRSSSSKEYRLVALQPSMLVDQLHQEAVYITEGTESGRNGRPSATFPMILACLQQIRRPPPPYSKTWGALCYDSAVRAVPPTDPLFTLVRSQIPCSGVYDTFGASHCCMSTTTCTCI